MATQTPAHELTEDFVDVIFRAKSSTSIGENEGQRFYQDWIEQASAKHSAPEQFAAEKLRGLYPNHSLVLTSDYRLNLLNFPGVQAVPIETTPLISELVFFPLARRLGGPLGVIGDNVEVGAFNITWNGYKFIVYIAQWPIGFGSRTEYFILHEGSQEPARTMLLSAGIWADQLHNEIWVFDQGYWQKNHGLWEEVQKASWDDVILKEDFKKALQKDVYGFFSSREVYKQLAIPWKRGLIMYGPPGNGKTISLKTIMKTCDARGFAPLYVKSFQSWKGEEGAMADVFDKARQVSPCVLILEDLDSLINDRNRSFFLNQLDGLEGNDGLLVIGTTNHFERLDPGLSTRPSRFDRKFLFDDPDRDERALYARYWQNKLISNKEVDFPDSLVDQVADSTDRFSFAYLKEAFVATLVTLAGLEDDEKVSFESILKSQIKTLRKQLDKPLGNAIFQTKKPTAELNSPAESSPAINHNIRDLLDRLSEAVSSRDSRGPRHYTTLPGAFHVHAEGRRDVRSLLDQLSEPRILRNVNDTQAPKYVYATLPSVPVNQRASRQHVTKDGRPFEWVSSGDSRKLPETGRGTNSTDRAFTTTGRSI